MILEALIPSAALVIAAIIFAWAFAWVQDRKNNPPHRHQWEEVSRGYSPPRGGKVRTDASDDLSEFFHGRTTILLRCTGCGWESHNHFAGRVDD